MITSRSGGRIISHHCQRPRPAARKGHDGTTDSSGLHGGPESEDSSGFHSAAIFGAPHGTPYPGIDNRIHQTAPDAFRLALKEDALWLDHWDFDIGGTLLGKGITVADLGNLATTPKQGAKNRKLIEACTRRILDAGAIPIMFGGDDSVPIPFIQAYSGQSPIVILQIDAHIDWREER